MLAIAQALLPIPSASAVAATPPLRALPAAQRPAARDYPDVLKAALFAPDRPSVPGVADIAGTLEGYRLLGVATSGAQVSAVVAGPGGRIARVGIGQKLGAWTLASADQSRLIFTNAGEQRVLLVSQFSEQHQ
ncbi:MAG TPA: hypothetical protein VMU01_10375 [Rhizomicrobium sp.]|nr:hypothetical protein [Rhizomicrobium sp.]